MTIPNQNRRSDTLGNDSTPNASYTFRIKDKNDIAVYLWQLATGLQLPVLTVDVDYTVNGPFNQDAGGTITIINAALLNAGNLPTNDRLTILGNRAISQTTSYKNNGGYFPARHENSYDDDTVVDQQQEEVLSRALTTEVTATIAMGDIVGNPNPGDFVKRNATNDGNEWVGLPGGSLVTPGTTVIGNISTWGDLVGDELLDSGIPVSGIATAQAAANAAQADATQALSDAAAAQGTANTAASDATQALSDAAAAQGTANTAASDATQALSDAAAAQGTANTADGKADANTSLLAGVQLETGGPATDFLDRTGNYSVPSGFGIGASVASASALPLLNDGRFNLVTGSVGITSMNSVSVGTIKTLEFAATCLVASNANIILNDGNDVVVSAGDKLTFYEFATGQWKLINYLSYTTSN